MTCIIVLVVKKLIPIHFPTLGDYYSIDKPSILLLSLSTPQNHNEQMSGQDQEGAKMWHLGEVL
jgi:hypothetical protein